MAAAVVAEAALSAPTPAGLASASAAVVEENSLAVAAGQGAGLDTQVVRVQDLAVLALYTRAAGSLLGQDQVADVH